MGKIAEMMLDGTLCEGCGEYLGDGDGFPQRCDGCSPEPSEQAKTKRARRRGQRPRLR